MAADTEAPLGTFETHVVDTPVMIHSTTTHRLVNCIITSFIFCNHSSSNRTVRFYGKILLWNEKSLDSISGFTLGMYVPAYDIIFFRCASKGSFTALGTLYCLASVNVASVRLKVLWEAGISSLFTNSPPFLVHSDSSIMHAVRF